MKLTDKLILNIKNIRKKLFLSTAPFLQQPCNSI